jgi:hypothetical protein
MRAVLLWMKLSLMAVCVMAVPAQAQVCKKKKNKKPVKKVVKKTKKATKKVTKNKKKFFSASKGIAVTSFNKLEDFDVEDLKDGVKFAENQYKKAKKKMAKLSKAALKKAFQNAFTRELKQKANLIKHMFIAAPLVRKPAVAIVKAITSGKMSRVETAMKALVKHPKLQKAIKLARRDFGTSLFVGYVASAGVGYSKGIAGSVSGTLIIGSAITLDENPKILIQNFGALGGGLQGGLSTSAGGSGGVDTGVVIGFIKGEASNVRGTCFDGGVGLTLGRISTAFGMCFPLDLTKTFVKAFGKPSIFAVSVTHAVGADPKENLEVSGGLTVGMSHTIGLGKLKGK